MLVIDLASLEGRWSQEVDEDGRLVWVRRRLRHDGQWRIAEVRAAD